MSNITGRLRLSGNPILGQPEDFNFEILDSNIPSPNPIPAPIPLPNPVETIDLRAVRIHNSPTDMADWAITRIITRLKVDRRTGWQFEFNIPLPENWKWRSNPANPEENYQYTVWPIILYRGAPNTSGIVDMWSGRVGTGGFELPTFHEDFHQNWCYDSRWGDMSLYYPNPGDMMGFFVSAGHARGVAGITSVKERSNVVVVRLPIDDLGDWIF
jgi:hypothetical protein